MLLLGCCCLLLLPLQQFIDEREVSSKLTAKLIAAIRGVDANRKQWKMCISIGKSIKSITILHFLIGS